MNGDNDGEFRLFLMNDDSDGIFLLFIVRHHLRHQNERHEIY